VPSTAEAYDSGLRSSYDVRASRATSSSGRTRRQLDFAEYRSAVLVDRQMYSVVGVETHQLNDAVKNLPQVRTRISTIRPSLIHRI